MPPERKADTSRARTFVFNAAALWLLLLAPFVVFLDRHHYSLLNPEIASCFGIAAGLALVVAAAAQRPALRVLAIALAVALAFDAQFDWFGAREQVVAVALVAGVGWVLREHLASIVALTSLTFLVTTVALGRTPQRTEPSLAGGNDKRPFVLHVVLDEHVGFAGLPHGARYDAPVERLKSFFDRRGFRRFTDAYSEYFWTRYSFSQMLNFSNGRYTPHLFRIGRDARFELVENRYFSRVAEQGYSINVFQTTYLDVCPDAHTVAHCESHDFAGIRELQYSQLNWKDRLYAVSGAYLRRLSIYDQLLRRVSRFLKNNADHPSLPGWVANSIRALPPLMRKRPPEHYASIATQVLAERLIAAVSGARRGQYVFAHLMLPHYPYVFLPDCSFRPPSEWNDRTDPDAGRTSNTPQGREARYLQYLDQLECLYKDLDRLLDAIPKDLQRDAVVILHGDHGSRITIVDPDAGSRRALTSGDVRDAYSTLLAVKGPAVPTGDDERRVAIGCVLAAVVESEFTTASPNPSCNPGHTVFKVPRQGQVIAATVAAATYAP